MTNKIKTAFAQTNGKKSDQTACPIDLIPDGIKRKPPIAVRERSNGRDSISHSDVSSSRPNSTTDDDFDEEEDDDDEDEEDDLMNAASESCPESDSADTSNNDENDEQQADAKANADKKLEPISEEASTLRQRSDDENGLKCSKYNIFIL